MMLTPIIPTKKPVKTPIKFNGLDIKKLPIKGLNPIRETNTEKIHVTTSHTDNSISILIQDMRIAVRKNGTKYERHTQNITIASDLQYANVIMGHITALMKEFDNASSPLININIDALNVLASIGENTDMTEHFNKNAPVNMKTGYEKIAHDLGVTCGTATSIRVICNRLVPPEVKPKTNKTKVSVIFNDRLRRTMMQTPAFIDLFGRIKEIKELKAVANVVYTFVTNQTHKGKIESMYKNFSCVHSVKFETIEMVVETK